MREHSSWGAVGEAAATVTAIPPESWARAGPRAFPGSGRSRGWPGAGVWTGGCRAAGSTWSYLQIETEPILWKIIIESFLFVRRPTDRSTDQPT